MSISFFEEIYGYLGDGESFIFFLFLYFLDVECCIEIMFED